LKESPAARMCAWRWPLSLCGERSTAERRGVIRG